nr:PREDICTED: PDZ and LIM domain protein Zasp-like isoform X2 [Bemisia tabaci]
MAQLVTVKLVRHDNTPWGFRLQGGKDFGTPLLIQKVNGGSIAERAGLAVGDGLVTVNGYDVFNLKHKEAQDAIVQGGNCLELQVQRGGGSTWKPLVQNVGATPSPLSHVSGPPPFVTKTSLAANKYPSKPIGSGHNVAPKPFNGLPHSQLNGTSNGQVKAIVNKQYNTPVGMYSEETIAETLSAQAEVLAGGVIGVNFKKNEKNYDAQKSEVFKMVHEVDAEPKSPEPEQPIEQNGVVIPPPVKGLRHVSAPENKPSSQTHGGSQPLLPGQNICADCERLIVGVFVRIKDKNLHVECFKCATCGTSLKNVGYYTINNKLYCDIHAKMIARQNPPAPNLEPITVSPGGRIPSNVVSNAVSSAMSPKSNPVSSPFQVRTVPMHVSPRPTPTPPQTPNANVLSPKSYNGTAAPLTPPISRNFSQPQTVGESKIDSSSWQTCSSGNGLCPSPLPSTPGYILPTNKPSTSNPENLNPLFASLPSASKVQPGTNCLSPAPLPSVPGYVSPDLREAINPNPLFSSLPSASKVKPGTNCLSPAPLPSVPGYVSPTPRTVASTQPAIPNVASKSTMSVASSQNVRKEQTTVQSSHSESTQQKSFEEIYGIPSGVKQLKPIPQARSQSPCMWSGSSHEISYSGVNAAKTLSCTLETQIMLKTIKETGRWSPVPPVDPALSRQFPTNLCFTNYETQEPSNYVPPKIQTAVVPTFLQKPTPPPPVISFPPDFDPTPVVKEYVRSRSSTPVPRSHEIDAKSADRESKQFSVEGVAGKKSMTEVSSSGQKSAEKPLAVEPICERKYIAQVSTYNRDVSTEKSAQLEKEAHAAKFDTTFLSASKEEPPADFPLGDQLVNPDGSSSVTLPPDSAPYYPDSMRDKPEPKIFRPQTPPSGSPLCFALTTAPARSYSPLPSVTKPPTPPPADALPDFETELPVIPGVRPVSMLAALTVASERPYSPVLPSNPTFHSVSAKTKEEQKEEKKESYISTLKKDVWSPRSLLEVTVTSDDDSYDVEKYVSQNPEMKGKQCVKLPRHASPSRLSFTNSGLHKPSTIPPYQQTLGDGSYTPTRSRSPQPPAVTPKATEGKSTQGKDSTSVKEVCRNTPTPKGETKPLKSCVKTSHTETAASTKVTSTQSTSVSECKKSAQVCCKKVTIADSPITGPTGGSCTRPCQKEASSDKTVQSTCSHVCNRAEKVCCKKVNKSEQPSCASPVGIPPTVTVVCEPATCERSACQTTKTCERSTRAQLFEEPKETLSKTCPYFISGAESTEKAISVSSSSASAEKTKQTTVEGKSTTQTQCKQVCSLSSSATCTKKVRIEEHSSSISSSVIGSSVECKVADVCSRSTKADAGTAMCSRTCSQSKASSVSDSATGSSSSICQTSSSKSSQVTTTESSQSKPSPVTSTKLSLSTAHRLSPLAVADIPTDANQSTFCKTPSGSQIFKPPVSAKLAETKQKSTSETTSKQETKTSCSLTKQSISKTEVKSIPLTEAASLTPCPLVTATPPSTPTTVSQSPNSAFSLPRKTSGSVASSLSKTLSAKIAASNHSSNTISSSQPASIPNTGASTPNSGAGATKGGTAAGLTAPRRGRGVLNPQNLTPGARVPLCGQCHEHIRGPFITALGKIWCPDHFICVNKDCRRPLQDIGFVEESSGLYCEYCFEKYLAPTCHKCSNKIKGDCLNAIGKHFHPECFKCAFCSKLFGNNPFFLEEGLPYCENDWNELFTTKCFACGFPIEAGDRWVEALNNNYHSPCFNCTMCKKNLEGESFYAKGGRPYCKSHAR